MYVKFDQICFWHLLRDFFSFPIVYEYLLLLLSHFSQFGSLRPYGLACQAPLSKGFSRQEYWSGFLCPFPGDLLNPGVEPESLRSSAFAGRLITTRATWEAPMTKIDIKI